MASIGLANISRRFSQEFYALRDVSFEIKDREVVTVLEFSGCGKSTLLRVIAGLDQPSEGKVWIGDGKRPPGAIQRYSHGLSIPRSLSAQELL